MIIISIKCLIAVVRDELHDPNHLILVTVAQIIQFVD